MQRVENNGTLNSINQLDEKKHTCHVLLMAYWTVQQSVITWIDGPESHIRGTDVVSFDFITLDRHIKGPNDVQTQVPSHRSRDLK